MKRLIQGINGLDNHNILGAIIFVVAMLFIYLCLILLPDFFYQQHTPPDFINGYEPTALSILAGEGIRGADGEVMVRWGPGFPVLIAGVYGLADIIQDDRSTMLDIVIILLCASSCVLIFYLVKGLSKSALRGLIAASLWLTYPFFLRLTNLPLTEPMFIVLLLFAVLLFFYTTQEDTPILLPIFICGIILGCLLLVRSAAIYLIVVFVLLLLFNGLSLSLSQRFASIALMIIGLVVTVAPWQLYINSNLEPPVFLTSSGFGTAYFGYTFAVSPSRPYYPSVIDLSDSIIVMQQDIRNEVNNGSIESLGGIISYMWQQLFDRPVTTIQFMLIKALRSWYSTSSTKQDNLVFFAQIPYLVVSLLAIIKIALNATRLERHILITVLLIVCYFWAIATLTFSIFRYLVPIMPLLFTLIAIAIPLPAMLAQEDSVKPSI